MTEIKIIAAVNTLHCKRSAPKRTATTSDIDKVYGFPLRSALARNAISTGRHKLFRQNLK